METKILIFFGCQRRFALHKYDCGRVLWDTARSDQYEALFFFSTGCENATLNTAALPPQRMYKGVANSTPWLILAGSGGVADILVTLMNRGCWDTESVHELLLDTFPNAHHSTDRSNWVKLVRDRCAQHAGRSCCCCCCH